MSKNAITGTGFESSVINDASTDDGDLIIEFKNGTSYRYTGAGDLFKPLQDASSAGQYFNAHIKNEFTAVAL